MAIPKIFLSLRQQGSANLKKAGQACFTFKKREEIFLKKIFVLKKNARLGRKELGSDSKMEVCALSVG